MKVVTCKGLLASGEEPVLVLHSCAHYLLCVERAGGTYKTESFGRSLAQTLCGRRVERLKVCLIPCAQEESHKGSNGELATRPIESIHHWL
eukprot:4980736-Amphidinium_carterae.1